MISAKDVIIYVAIALLLYLSYLFFAAAIPSRYFLVKIFQLCCLPFYYVVIWGHVVFVYSYLCH